MYKLNGHSLQRGAWFEPETQPMTLIERNSSSSITLGPDAPEIGFNDWLLDDEWPESPIVWRVKSLDDQTDTETRTISLEHVIRLLEDTKLFEDVETSDIAGGETCTARQAIGYLLARQSDWVLGDCGNDVSLPYEFSGGDSLLDAIESVSETLEDAEWWYDLSVYPFVLNIRKRNSAVMSEMRGGRNVSTLRRSISRSGMYTRIWPVGQNDLHISGAYLSRNESVYGRVDKVETNQGKTSEASLRAWAAAMLRHHCEPLVTITISGLELSQETGETLDWIQLNRVCRCPLPEFHTTILERVIKIQWRDRRKDPESVTVTLGNNAADVRDLTKTVEETSKSSGRGARGQAKQNYLFEANGEHLLYEVFDECGHLHGILRMTEQSLRVAFENLNECTRSEFYMTSESLRVQFENEINSTRSEFRITSESLRVQFENEINSTRSEFRITSESLRVQFENEINSTRSQLEITSESLRTEFTNEINSTRSEFRITSESLRVQFENEIASTRSEFRITSESLRVQFENENASTRSQLEITSESLRSTISDTASGLQTQIDQNAGQIALRVAKGDVGTQLAVELGNVSISGGNLVVDGYVKASELTADRINSLFSGTQVFSSNYAFIRNLECTNFTQGEYTMDLSDALWDVKVELNSGNTYTLYKKHFYSSDWASAGNFSRAVTSIDWSWSGGMAKAVLTPQGQTFYSKQIDAIQPHGQATWDDDKKGFTVTLDVDDTEGTTVFSDDMHFNTTSSYDQGHTDGYAVAKGNYTKSGGVLKVTKSTSGTAFPISFAIDAGIAYNSSTHKYTAKALCDDDLMDSTESGTEAFDAGRTAGYNSATGSYTKSGGVLKITKGTGGTAFPISFSIDAAITYNSTTHKYTAKALCDDDQMDTAESGTQAYDAGVADGEGKFTLASVTLQGAAHSVTPISGTALRLGSDVTVTPIGTTSVRLGSAGTYYEAGTLTPYFKGDGGSFTVQGESVSVTPIIATSAIRLGTKTTIDGQQYYPVVSSGGTLYYQKGSQAKYYKAGTTTKYARGEGISVTPIAGGGITCRPVLSSGGTVFYRAGTPEVYMPVLSSGGTEYFTAGTPLDLYDAGSTITDVYYTKTA